MINGNIEHKQSITVDGLIVESATNTCTWAALSSQTGPLPHHQRSRQQQNVPHIKVYIIYQQKQWYSLCYQTPSIRGSPDVHLAVKLWVVTEWNIRPVTKQYMWCIKQMLGVRKTTPNDLCLTGLGCPPLQVLVNQRRRKFSRACGRSGVGWRTTH